MGLAQSRAAASTDVSAQSTSGNPVLSSNQDQVQGSDDQDEAALEAAGAQILALLEDYLSLTVSAPSAYLPELEEEEEEEATTDEAGDTSDDTLDLDDDLTTDPADQEEQPTLPDPVNVTFQSLYWTNRWGDAGSKFPTALSGVTGEMLDGQPVGEGRGSPEEMEAVVQAGLDAREIVPPPPLPGPDAPLDAATWEGIIESWMQDNGVGIDCSGFVTLALMDLGVDVSFIGTLTGIGPDNYQKILKNRDVDEADIQPLDIMYLGTPTDEAAAEPRHVRIVVSAEDVDGGHEFTTAESSWTPRAGEDPTDAMLQGRGPRVYEWRWADDQLYGRHPGTDEWIPSSEDPAYMRILDDDRASLPGSTAE